METPREKEIREHNEMAHNWGVKLLAKDRHERRHNNGSRTTLEERSEFVKIMSQD